MTGALSAFSELDTGICVTVKFGDGSVVDIKGRGTVLYKCRNGEHRALGGVYHIPHLTANIVSLGSSTRSSTSGPAKLMFSPSGISSGACWPRWNARRTGSMSSSLTSGG